MNKYNEKSVLLQWLHLFIVKMSGSHNYTYSKHLSQQMLSNESSASKVYITASNGVTSYI